VTTKYKDYPFDECAAAADKIALAGGLVFQKWTCAGCGERVTANLPNHWTEKGHHEERENGMFCGHVTDIRASGCNYMVVQSCGGRPDPGQSLFEYVMFGNRKSHPRSK
jgi:hypothetical protein